MVVNRRGVLDQGLDLKIHETVTGPSMGYGNQVMVRPMGLLFLISDISKRDKQIETVLKNCYNMLLYNIYFKENMSLPFRYDFVFCTVLLMIAICLQQIYLNTSALIAHEIKTNLTNRKDLALTYYPSEYEFYWFVSRTFSKLQEHSQNQRLHPVSSIQVLQVQQLYEIIFVFHIFLLYHKSLTHLIYKSAQYFLILKVFQRFHFSVFLSPIEVVF